MTLSVLLSVYKSERPEHLDRALQSVWTDQSRRPDQIVLVEDGPLTDGLSEVVARWRELTGTVMTVCRNDVNLGLTKSLNVGLGAVTSDLVARMDSDDLSHPRRFEWQLAYLEQHPEVHIVGGSLQEFDQKHPCLNVRHYPPTHEEAVSYIVKASPLAHPAVMMRMSMFRQGLRYDERYRMSQDIKLWFDAILAGYRIGNVQEVCLYFRREGDVFRRRSRAKAWNEFKIYMNGIYRLHGLLTFYYLYPIARYLFRNLPPSMVRRIYGSRMRNAVLERKHVQFQLTNN